MIRAPFPAAAILLVLCVGFAAGRPARQAEPQARGGKIRVPVNLVMILASVNDKEGRPVLDLPAGAFQISEEGVPQKIARFEAETTQPLDLALMIDTSGSTYKDLKFEREAAVRFFQQIVRPPDQAALFAFDEDVTQLSPFSSDAARLEAATHRLEGGAGTALYDAVALGSQALRRLPEDRRRALVLVTDAGETTSRSKYEEARDTAITAGTLLYTIVLRTEDSENMRNTAGEHALQTITDSTGGDMLFLHDIGELDEMFSRINRELRTQYLLGYYPLPAPPPHSFRHIAVSVKGDFAIHARKTYLTAGAP